MSETETLFVALRQSADEVVVDMLERIVRDAPDHALNRMNALDLAAKADLGEERVIAALLHAVGLGMLEMTWNVMCPSCAGVLSANKSLKTLNSAQYNCAFCAAGYETTLDSLAASRSIVVTELVVENANSRTLLETNGLTPTRRSVALSGIADKVSVYEIS